MGIQKIYKKNLLLAKIYHEIYFRIYFQVLFSTSFTTCQKVLWCLIKSHKALFNFCTTACSNSWKKSIKCLFKCMDVSDWFLQRFAVNSYTESCLVYCTSIVDSKN